MRKIGLIAICAWLCTSAIAQGDSTILVAMKDEMTRSMAELRTDDSLAPFFISYGFSDQMTRAASATLGSFGGFNKTPKRNISARLMVGSYELNDESFESNTEIEGSFENDIIPLENDYWALRRAFWHSTDNIYRRASKYYKEHLKFIRKSELPLDSLPHHWFTKAEPAVYHESNKVTDASDAEMIEKSIALSNMFIPYKNLKNSYVTLRDYQTTNYLVNTEGTEVVTTEIQLILTLKADIMLESGKVESNQLTYLGHSFADLPADSSIEVDLKAMIAKLMDDSTGVEIEEDYNGPVLYLGRTTSLVFNSNLVNSYKSNLVDAPNKEKKGATYNSNVKKMEEKIGEKILPEFLSIKLKPHLKEFNGTTLVGRYEADIEGVRPADEIVLVENGVLKNVMTSRTVSNKDQKPNGTASGPGVIEVTSSKVLDDDKLKKELINLAKKEHLKYAVLVRRDVHGTRTSSLYRVSLKTGEETYIKNASLGYFGSSDLDDLVAVGPEMTCYNTYSFNGSGSTTVIAPKAALLKNRTVTKSRYTYNPEKPLVASPLLE